MEKNYYIPSVMRIAIIGSGGVGGYLGARLHNAGKDVVFVARGAHLQAMQEHGLKLESPEGDLTINTTFTDTLFGFKPFDYIFIGVKSFDTSAAAEIAAPVLKDDSLVLSIQNGVENEDVLAEVIGKKYVLTGIAYIFSTIHSPGIIRHEGRAGKFRFGEMNGMVSQRCRELEKTLCSAGIDCEAIENIGKFLWQKWIFICGLGGMTAFAKKSMGQILNDASLRHLLLNVITEASIVARAMYKDPFTDSERKTILHCERLPSTSTSSMYYDLTHGKRLEAEALNGAVVRFGKKLNIPTPANYEIYSALKQYAG
jgi:2-dehydropantoate 2-reductase